MNTEKNTAGDFFEQYGLRLVHGTLEVGKVYPVFGAITKFIDETLGSVIVELNYGLNVSMNVPDQERLEVLKKHAFESGIFVSKVIETDPCIHLECQTVIFGKSQSYNA